jgi:hypothetical protein
MLLMAPTRDPVYAFRMSPNAAADTMTDDEARKLQRALNQYEPKDVYASLDGLDGRLTRGPRMSAVAAGPSVGGGAPGALIYKLDDERVRLRVTVADINGAFYEELEMPATNLEDLIKVMLVTLEREKAPRNQ